MKSWPDLVTPTRSALDDFPAPSVPPVPTVAAIVPVYNEQAHCAAIVSAMLGQDYEGLCEIWFVDGISDDGTREELERLARHDPRVHILANPRRVQSAAINMAAARSSADIVMRLDAHAHYAPDVIRRSVDALLHTGAGGVGAIARPVPADTIVGESIVAAHRSRLGVGVARFRRESSAGWVDTIWNGCYWRYIFDAVDGLREDLPRNEDNDFNARVRALGYGLYLEPAIHAYYVPRQTLGGLWRQYFATGLGVGQTFVESRQSISTRHFIPFAFVCGMLALVIGSLAGMRRFQHGLAASLACYSTALIAGSAAAAIERPGRYAVLMPVALATLHFSYGIGTMIGMARSLACREAK